MAFADECYVDDPDIRGTYTGGCVNGKAHGQGESKGKDHYKGEFVNGKAQGKGVYTSAGGGKYDGEWKDGERLGKGVYTWPNGNKYDGEFKDGKRHGLGKLTFPKGHKSIATWSKGFWQGDTYIVQGIFENGDNLVLECEPNKQACEKARIEKEKAEIKTNEQACKNRYVGELIEQERYTIFGPVTVELRVQGVGSTKMTVRETHSGLTYNVACNAY